jgi:chemotaxis signal transduction protein
MPNETVAAETVLYCGFRVGERRFGVPVALVKEVHAPTTITAIPGAPPEVRGYVNLRGNLYLVLDPRALLTGEPVNNAETGNFIVFKATAGENFAIQTDGVDDIVAICGEQIDVPKDETRRGNGKDNHLQRLIIGHAKLDNGLMTLVEPRELLNAAFHGSQAT